MATTAIDTDVVDGATALRRWARLVLAFVLLGAGLRLGQYLWDRSYWQDEAFLVLNILQKDAGQLMGKLDARPAAPQAAPPLFLLAQRGLYLTLGGSEYALRLVPLLLGSLALGWFAWVAWRELEPIGAATAVALFALSDRLIWHAVEAKQYSSDVFFAVLLLALGLRVIRPSRPDPLASSRAFLWTALVAAVALWCSHPAIFVFAAVSLTAGTGMLSEGRRPRLAWMAGNILVAASFLALYLLSVRVQQDPHFYAYWAADLVPWQRWWTIPWWLLQQTYKLFDYPFANAGAVLLILSILGAARWRRERPQALAMVLWPIGLLVMAAALQRYPYGGRRLNLFAAPGLFLLAGAGVVWLKQLRMALAAGTRNWALLIPLVLVAAELLAGGYHLFVPRMRGHLRPAVAFVRQHYSPGDPIVALSREEFLCYWPDAPLLSGQEALSRQPARFWVVWSYPSPTKPPREFSELLRQLQELGVEHPGESFRGEGGAAVLIDSKD